MKKTFRLLALAVMLIMGSQAMAQTRGALLLGASFPVKDFADFDKASEFALASDDDNAGAAIGFNVGLKWYFNVGVKGLGVMLSVDGMYNGLNADAKAFYKERKDLLYTFGTNAEMTRPVYINLPVMLGLNYIYHINPSFGVYAEAGVGGNARFITSYNESYKFLGNKNSATVKYGTPFSFAWQVGAGIEVARNLVIGCSSYDLGKAEVKAEKTGDISTTPMPNGSTIHPVMVLARIGFSF